MIKDQEANKVMCTFSLEQTKTQQLRRSYQKTFICMTEIYLTDELNVRRRPAERFWKYIKIKRLNNVPAEIGKTKKRH